MMDHILALTTRSGRQTTRSGQGLVEYAFIVALIGIVSIAGVAAVGRLTSNQFGKVSNGLSGGAVGGSSGTNWRIASSPNSSTTQTSYLLGIACANVSACYAVGASLPGSYDQTLIERWDGSSWTIAPSPNSSTIQNNSLLSIACVSATACYAVGSYRPGSWEQTLVEQWDGVNWTIVSSPNSSPTQDNKLQGIACATANSCYAVGYALPGSYEQTLIEKWDGSNWTIVSSPNSSTIQNNSLQGIACVSTIACYAVGYYRPASWEQTLVEQWDGSSWTIATSPNSSSTQVNYLEGIACTSAIACFADGYSLPSHSQTLIERWNGVNWTIASSPNSATTQNNSLQGIACASANACYAVGSYVPSIYDQTLVENWDGSSWTIASSPSSSTTQVNGLAGIACASATACYAVGNFQNPTWDQTLVVSGP